MIIFVGATVTKQGQDFVWPYFKDNVKLLLDKFGGANNSLFQHVLKVIFQQRFSPSRLNTFFRSLATAIALKM